MKLYTQGNQLVWYTDGSKTHNPIYNKYISLGIQAEIQAIEICLGKSSRKGYRGREILTFFDSQAAIKVYAIRSCQSRSGIVQHSGQP